MSTHTSPEGSSPADAQQDRDEIIINELIDAEARATPPRRVRRSSTPRPRTPRWPAASPTPAAS